MLSLQCLKFLIPFVVDSTGHFCLLILNKNLKVGYERLVRDMKIFLILEKRIFFRKCVVVFGGLGISISHQQKQGIKNLKLSVNFGFMLRRRKPIFKSDQV